MLAVANLLATQDTTIYEEAEDESVQANGAGFDMFIGTNGMNRERRGLVKFDVAAEIPPGSTIRGVELKLEKFSPEVAAQGITLHVVTNDWGEGTSAANPGDNGAMPTVDSATWNFRRYGNDLIRWNSPGGDFAADESALGLVQGPGTYTWDDARMIQDVTEWLADPDTNHGWLLLGDDPSPDALKGFVTREGGSGPTLIVDYDPPFDAEIEIADAAPVSEGNEGDSNTLLFEVTISQIPLEPVTVNYTTHVASEGNPASENEDFMPQSGQLTFGNGLEPTQTIQVPIVGDEINENNETLLVTLSDVQGSAFLRRPEAIGEILDDDPLPTLSIADAEYTEGDEGTINYGLTVTLSEPSSKEVVVKYEHTDESATWDEDYRTTLPGIITFAAGETERTIGVQINGDNEKEGNEDFLIDLFDPENAELSEEKTARITIIDDDEDDVEYPWHNSEWPEDVRGDGNVIPLDALLVINAINNGDAGPLAPPTEPGTPPPYLDVSADNFLSPIDALLVINYINDPPLAAEAEMDASSPETMDDALLTQIAASALAVGFEIDEADDSNRVRRQRA